MTQKMFSIFVMVLLYCLEYSKGQNCEEQEHSNPILVHVLFRHGDRTPVFGNIYPKDPHKSETYSPVGRGQLTPNGKLKMFKLGQFIRKRYDKLFGGFYVPGMLRAYSTNMARTKMSMQLVLAGLLPPRDAEVWNEDLAWQPIPYDYLPIDQDKIFFSAACPNYINLYQEYLKSEEVVDVYKKEHKLLQYLSENTGWNITSFVKVYKLYLCLSSELAWGLKLPEWTKNVYPEELERVTAEQYRILSGTTELMKLSSGYWLQKIIKDTEQKINDVLPQERIAFLYSGHEQNIANLLHTLSSFDQQVPEYGSALFIELHRVEGKFGIQVLYRNDGNDTKFLILPGCGQFCPWEKFLGIIEKYLPTESTCGGPISYYAYMQNVLLW